MIDEELVKRHETAVNEVNDKIAYLDSCIDDLKEAIGKFWDIENKFPAEALNELLKMGLLPGVVFEIPEDKKRWRLNGTPPPTMRISPLFRMKRGTRMFTMLWTNCINTATYGTL